MGVFLAQGGGGEKLSYCGTLGPRGGTSSFAKACTGRKGKATALPMKKPKKETKGPWGKKKKKKGKRDY